MGKRIEASVSDNKVRERWIDFLKAVAIIAVLQNHLPEEAKLFDVLYSAYSVSLFVLCSGITSAISLERQTRFEYKTYLIKKLKNVIFPYFVATCGYVIFDMGYLDVFYMFNKLLTFSYGSNGHMYYLVFYLELVLVAPLLVRLYSGKREQVQIEILAISIILSIVFERYTYLNKFELGSKYLFGGSYFFLFNLGIYIFFHLKWLKRLSVKIVTVFISIGMLGYIIYKEWCLVWWSNPPSVKLIVYTIVVFLLCYNFIILMQLLTKIGKVKRCVEILMELVCIIGRNSLYIYLWHMMLVDALLKKGLFTKEWGGVEKIIINCFILYSICLLRVLYNKGVKIVHNKLYE